MTDDDVTASVVIDTPHGPVRLSRFAARLWETRGWPPDDVIRAMIDDQREDEAS